ncbi:MAG: SlyX family protein [Pseudomonadota bacterium]|nr:SlyX family protein [Pseudomonadota bacterium]
MKDTDRIEDRLTDLEVKASFTEDMLDKLNQVIVQQQTQIDLLLRGMAELRQRNSIGEEGGFRSLRDELPPHY